MTASDGIDTGAQAATFRRFLDALARTERLPAAELLAYQRRLLATLLRHARSQTDFYAGPVSRLFRPDDTVDWDRWYELPVLKRSDVQANEAALTARALPPTTGAVRVRRSSGSTGEPLNYPVSQLQNLGAAAANERFFDWHRLDPAALTAFIWAMDEPGQAAWPEGQAARQWRPYRPESRATDLAINTPIAQQVEWLRRQNARYLSSYPNNVLEIGRVAAEEGAPLAFDAVLTNSEMTTPEAEREITELFGCAPIDRYGTTEAGLISAHCEHRRHHLMAELAAVEILDEEDRPAPAGEPGRIVVTPFYAMALPLIRYDTGDWAALSPAPCPCGRTLPHLERIYGRSRNIFRFSDGSRVWPVLASMDVYRFVPHRKYQVVQVAPDEIEYRYVPVDPALPIDDAGLAAFARERLNPNVTVRAIAVADIPRSQRGKLEDYISLVG